MRTATVMQKQPYCTTKWAWLCGSRTLLTKTGNSWIWPKGHSMPTFDLVQWFSTGCTLELPKELSQTAMPELHPKFQFKWSEVRAWICVF